MKIECTVEELNKLIKITPVDTTDELPKHLSCNIPPIKS